MEHYSAVKKNETMPFATTWMDLEIIMLNDVGKTIPYNITYMWHLKYGTNELIYETETDRHRQQICDCTGRGTREGRIGSLGLACKVV